MELVTPGIGLMFWMLLSFSIVFFILAKFAWPVILSSLKDREKSIEDALQSAQRAKEDMQQLKSDNEKILDQARIERNKMIQEGKEIKDKIVNESKSAAEKEADKIMQQARQAIEKEKSAAIEEMKAQIASLSVDIAQKILQQKLSADKDQKDFIDRLLDNYKTN